MHKKLSAWAFGYVAVIAVGTWLAIIFQCYLSTRYGLAHGQSPIFIALRLTNYFTILSNLLVATVLTSVVINRFTGRCAFFCRPGVQTAVAMYITVVAAVYALVLTRHLHPTGVYKLASTFLHDVTPAAYLAYWLAFAPKGGLRWQQTFRWLIFPVVYGVYVLIRGAVSDFYPYPFANVAQRGYPQVLANLLILLAAMECLALVFVAIDRWLGRLSSIAPQPGLVSLEETA